ncbi:unnamed protein product [Prunus brigantina]
MPSRDGSKAPSSQVPLYLWGGSEVYKKRFVANLHRVTNEDKFQRWRAAYASAIPEDVHIKLAKPLTDNMPCVDANDPNARIITFLLAKEITCGMMMCWKSADGGKAMLVMVHLFPSHIATAEVKSPRTQATSSQARNVFPLRKKPKLPSAEKIQVGVVPSSSARVKHLVGADSKKIGGMRNIRDAPLKPLADELEDHDLLREVVRARSSSPVERQRDADVPPRSSSRLHQSKSGGRCGRSVHPSNRHDPTVESREVKRGVDSTSQIPLEVRLAEARKARESSARTKGSSVTSAADPKVDKSSPAGDAGVSDLLKTQFLSSPSSCVELVDQIRQAGNLGTFSSLSLEKQREATLHLLQKGVVFAAETIRNSSAVAPSLAQLSELEKKNAELVSKLSAEQTRYEKKTSDLRAMISELKSSLAEKDSELNSSATDLASRKDAYFHLERKNADISHSYDKLLARFHAYQFQRCRHLYPDLPLAKSEEANAVNTEGAEE